jgi:hypothetical protein
MPSLGELVLAHDGAREGALATGVVPPSAWVAACDRRRRARDERPALPALPARPAHPARPARPARPLRPTASPCHVYVRVQDLLSLLARLDAATLTQDLDALVQSGKPSAPPPSAAAGKARARGQLRRSDVVVYDGSRDWIVRDLERTVRRMHSVAADAVVDDGDTLASDSRRWLGRLFARAHAALETDGGRSGGLTSERPCHCWWKGKWRWCARVLSTSALP